MYNMIVYKATNKVNGKVYVGQTIQSWSNRKAEHKNRHPDSRNHFHRSIRKYGWDSFEWKVIDTANSIDELNEKEVFWISVFDSFNNGYNGTYGGQNAHHSEETRKKISESRKGKKLSKNHPFKASMKGKKHTEETKRKISLAKLGKPRTEETRRKISISHTGKVLSEEHRRNIGISKTGEKNYWYGKGYLLSGENNSFYGRRHTEETKRKIGNANRGRKHPNRKRVKVNT